VQPRERHSVCGETQQKPKNALVPYQDFLATRRTFDIERLKKEQRRLSETTGRGFGTTHGRVLYRSDSSTLVGSYEPQRSIMPGAPKPIVAVRDFA
jgi:hypothetical protein